MPEAWCAWGLDQENVQPYSGTDYKISFKNKYLLYGVCLTPIHRAHPADGDQRVDDLRQAFFPRAAALEARGDGVFGEPYAMPLRLAPHSMCAA